MKSIAILTGGKSTEREVALWSAEYVEETLSGRAVVARYVLPEEIERFLSDRASFDLVVPVLHGKGGEDGEIQGFLKTLNLPFLFSDVEAHAVGMDKRLAKLVARDAGIATPEAVVVSNGETPSVTLPVVVKPIDGGSTIGVSIVREPDELAAALERTFAVSEGAVVESFVAGREFTVAVIDDPGPVALPVVEILPKDGFFDFESKYVDGKMAGEQCPAQIQDDLRDQLQIAATTMHRAIGARHATRSDFIVDANGQLWFLEINTIPGMTKNSLLPKAVRESGREFGELLMRWCEEAVSRQHGSR